MSLSFLVNGSLRTTDYFLCPNAPAPQANVETVDYVWPDGFTYKTKFHRALEFKEIRPSRFWYKCPVHFARAVDGDTVEITLDMTLGVGLKARLRLASINAPKLEPEDVQDSPGNRSQAFLKRLIQAHTHIWVRTLQNKRNEPKKTFDRYIAFLFTPVGQCINDIMVREGLATPYMIEVLDEGESFVFVDNPS